MKPSKGIVTEYENLSVFSARKAEERHHLIFGNGAREIAEVDGVWIPICHDEHTASRYGKTYQIHENLMAEKLSKMFGQAIWIMNRLAEELGNEDFTDRDWIKQMRTEFRNRYGETYF